MNKRGRNSSSRATIEKIFRSSSVKNKIHRQSLYKIEKAKKNKDRKYRREERIKKRTLMADNVRY